MLRVIAIPEKLKQKPAAKTNSCKYSKSTTNAGFCIHRISMTVIQYLHLQMNFALDFIEIYFALLQ